MQPIKFFTSDTHYGQQRTLELSKRPFSNVEEMDEYMIKQYNDVVSNDDHVLHIGDFGNYDIINRLNGDVTLLMGNYEEDDLVKLYNNDFDKYRDVLIEKGFYDVKRGSIRIIKDDLISTTKKESIPEILTCTHKPEDISPLFRTYHYGTENKPWAQYLFGHIHASQKIKAYGLNVGVDCSNFRVLSVDDVNFFFNAINNHYDDNVFY